MGRIARVCPPFAIPPFQKAKQSIGDRHASEAGKVATSVVTAAPTKTGAGGGGVTGTYALATLTQYNNLRESMTTSITLSAESGRPAATVAAVIFAGGVAWYLSGLVGGEAAALTVPKDGGPGHQDDDACKGDKPKCKDCGAVRGICISPKAGCTCEEEKCPETKPSCDAAKCKGDNGKTLNMQLEI